ncbi:NfeD family protein [Oculatella sp. LEGE 06141]|uniref:NfeD family protein n=1 Tax=Oculatella sp. LEGE 06141 TaxID=1828648 RepID=UPI00187EFE24|nr:NfeD family protein [Oculatella sp. LEGE 06141]MBE9179927.1 NfeD family protein [Oculatella sp. LEGE 06141]
MLNSQTVTFFPQVAEGKVDRTITAVQAGRIKFQGSYWPAQFYDADCQATVLPNDVVKVVGRISITLMVVPDGYSLPAQSEKTAQNPAEKWVSGITALFKPEGRRRLSAIAN